MSPYMQYPCFLSRALAFARLSQYETMVMAYVTEQSYGLTKTQVVHINQSNLARLFGVLRQRIQEAVTSLQKSNILVTADQGLSINPTFQEWVRPDLDWSEDKVNWIMATARQGVQAARYSVQSDTCNSTVQRAHSTAERAGSTVQRAIDTSESETCTPDRAPPARSSVHPLHARPCTPSDIPPDPPNRNARGIELKREEEEERKRESPQPRTQVQEPTRPEASPAPERSPFWEPKNIDELWAWVEEQEFDTSGMEGSQLTGICRTYTMRWVYYSLRIAVQRDIDQPKGFITKILREWHAKGQKAIQCGGLASVTPWIDYERIKLDEPEADDDDKPLTIEQRLENNRRIREAQAEKAKKVAEIMERVNREMAEKREQAEKRLRIGVAV